MRVSANGINTQWALPRRRLRRRLQTCPRAAAADTANLRAEIQQCFASMVRFKGHVWFLHGPAAEDQRSGCQAELFTCSSEQKPGAAPAI